MGRKLRIALAAAAAALLLLAAGAYALDSATKDTIDPGVSVGGVALGGLDEDEASRKLNAELVEPLSQPLTAAYEDEEFTLSAEKLDVTGDLDGMVDEALDVSTEGGMFGRLWRHLSGGEVGEDLEPRVSYSSEAVDHFVAKVGAGLSREPRNASVDPSAGSIQPVNSQPGLTVREDELREAIDRELQRPGSRRVEVEVDEVEPEVTTQQLASNYPYYLTVDRANFQLNFYENLELTKTYDVAIGAAGYDTPSGTYSIQDKQVDPTWYVPDAAWAGDLAGTTVPPGPGNPLRARWMGFYDGAGIHGTDDVGSIGSAASHGCIRMRVPDVIELYDRVPTGTPIYIG